MKFSASMFNSAFRPIGLKFKFGLKRKAPDILFTSGVALVIGGTVAACVKTPKVVEIVEDAKDELDYIKNEYENESVEVNSESVSMSKAEYQKELIKVYSKTAGKVAVELAPAIALEAGGIILLTKSHRILKNEKAAAAAMAAGFKKAYDSLYSNVKEKYGKEEADRMKFGVKQVECEEVVGKTKDGKDKVKKVTEEVIFDNPCEYSPYARFFDETCEGFYADNPNYNLKFLLDVQCMMNDKLKKDKFVFLNDVYGALGMEKVFPEGQTHGWLYDNSKSEGDNFIDFGIHNYKRPNRRFVNGYEPIVLLDFNCEGNIIDKINSGWALGGGFRSGRQSKYIKE